MVGKEYLFLQLNDLIPVEVTARYIQQFSLRTGITSVYFVCKKFPNNLKEFFPKVIFIEVDPSEFIVNHGSQGIHASLQSMDNFLSRLDGIDPSFVVEIGPQKWGGWISHSLEAEKILKIEIKSDESLLSSINRLKVDLQLSDEPKSPPLERVCFYASDSVHSKNEIISLVQEEWQRRPEGISKINFLNLDTETYFHKNFYQAMREVKSCGFVTFCKEDFWTLSSLGFRTLLFATNNVQSELPLYDDFQNIVTLKILGNLGDSATLSLNSRKNRDLTWFDIVSLIHSWKKNYIQELSFTKYIDKVNIYWKKSSGDYIGIESLNDLCEEFQLCRSLISDYKEQRLSSLRLDKYKKDPSLLQSSLNSLFEATSGAIDFIENRGKIKFNKIKNNYLLFHLTQDIFEKFSKFNEVGIDWKSSEWQARDFRQHIKDMSVTLMNRNSF